MSGRSTTALLAGMLAGGAAVWLARGGRAAWPGVEGPGSDRPAPIAASTRSERTERSGALGPNPGPAAVGAADEPAGPATMPSAAVRNPGGTADAQDGAAGDPGGFRRRLVQAAADSSRTEFLLREWARTDPAAFLDALPTLSLRGDLRPDSEGPPYLDALRLASEADPGYAFAVAEGAAGAVGEWIRATALEALAAEDPDAALDHLDGLEPGDARDRLLAAVATGFARADIEAAVRWLSTLGESDGAAFYPVIRALAVVDLSRAIELDAEALELDYGSSDYGDISWLRNGLEADRQNPARIADTFAAMQATGLLADLLSWWAMRDPYGAIAWIHTQRTISSWVIGRMAETIARRDYEDAMMLAAQFPPPVRAAWLESAFASSASFDVAGALETLERYRGETLYADAFAGIVGAALRDLGPAEAARIAADAPPSGLALRIARGWSESEPQAAADWALAIADESLRASVLRSVVQSWSRRDFESAAGWVLGVADETLRSDILADICPGGGTCVPPR